MGLAFCALYISEGLDEDHIDNMGENALQTLRNLQKYLTSSMRMEFLNLALCYIYSV